MSSSSTITVDQANYGIDLDQHIDHNSGSTQLVNTDSGPPEPVDTDPTLPTHHVPSHDAHSTDNSNNRNNPNRVARAMTFPPRQNNQTWHDYVVTNFKVITIVIALITLACTVIGIIAGIVIAIVRK